MTKTADDAAIYDLDALRAVAGPVAVREFEGSLEAFKADLYTWAIETLPTYDDRTFIQRASAAIYDSANMNRFRGMEHVHFKGSAFYTESARRHTLAHPDEDCNATTLYERAYNHSVRDAGYPQMASDLRPCTCKADATSDSPDATVEG